MPACPAPVRPFETFEHTADVGLIARGHTLEEAFCNAAAGLVDLMVDPEGLREDVHLKVTAEAADRAGLLVAWLNELLYLLDTQGFVPRRCRVIELRDTMLAAELSGDTVDPARHAVRRMVKAATYHGLSLTRTDTTWEARVILDV
jgi:SHS2 domain-containing protein